MRSETQTQYRQSLDKKLTLLILLWVVDKLIMLLMLWLMR